MANTYTELHIQYVFAVKYRAALIGHSWREELHKYLTGAVYNQGHKMVQVNSMPDHVHILLGFNPAISISDTVKELKTESSKWVKSKFRQASNFAWQEGYGAFSYSKEELKAVIEYIVNQETHHRGKSFLDEYCELLQQFDVQYNPRYIFNDPL